MLIHVVETILKQLSGLKDGSRDAQSQARRFGAYGLFPDFTLDRRMLATFVPVVKVATWRL